MAEVKEKEVEVKEKEGEKKEDVDYVSVIKKQQETINKLTGDVKGLLEILKGNGTGSRSETKSVADDEEEESEYYDLNDLINATKNYVKSKNER